MLYLDHSWSTQRWGWFVLRNPCPFLARGNSRHDVIVSGVPAKAILRGAITAEQLRASDQRSHRPSEADELESARTCEQS